MGRGANSDKHGPGAALRRAEAAEQVLASASAYGISTGWDAATRNDYRAAVDAALRFSQGTIELSSLSRLDLPALSSYLASEHAAHELPKFSHFSLHGPAKHLAGAGSDRYSEPNDADWQAIAADLAAVEIEPAVPIIFHPDTVTSLAALEPIADHVVFENMDARNQDGRTPAELERAFAALPRARFCLDVAHVWTVDESLELGHDLLDAFGERLAEVHVSGIDRTSCAHQVTVPADLERYGELLERCATCPGSSKALTRPESSEISGRDRPAA